MSRLKPITHSSEVGRAYPALVDSHKTSYGSVSGPDARQMPGVVDYREWNSTSVNCLTRLIVGIMSLPSPTRGVVINNRIGRSSRARDRTAQQPRNTIQTVSDMCSARRP